MLIPKSRPFGRLAALLCTALLVPAASTAQDRMPKENVVDVPAVGQGLAVHNLFQSNMVLQRGKPIRIWGWAAPGEKVVVTFGGVERPVVAGDDRKWMAVFEPHPASSEPRSMTIAGQDETLLLSNILIGDVWLLGGQSNMEFPLDRVDNGKLEIVSARYDELRILTVPAQNGPEPKPGFPRLHEWSGWFSRHFRKGDWDVCSPEIARELSAIGYVFARRIHMASRVPIGVIDVSRGGTTVETWTPDAVLREIDMPEVRDLLTGWDERVAAWDPQEDLRVRVASHERRVAQRKEKGQEIPADWKAPTDLRPGPEIDQNRPGNCYASMIHPIAGLGVKGAIFHQGYNNALGGVVSGAMYGRIFERMIHSWREAFGDPEMPFGIISLCTDGVPQTRDNFSEQMLNAGMLIREVQYQTFLGLRAAGDENVGFASSYDKRRSWYHPQEKLSVGERIARWALATQYGLEREIRWLPPQLREMETREGSLLLRFDRAVSPPDNKAAIEGFAIAGEDRRFHPATAEWFVKGKDAKNRPQFDRAALVLTSPMVPEPVHFRYAWSRNPMGNLQSADHNDLPVATQRSDDWPMWDVPLGVLEGKPLENGKLGRRERGQILRALRQQDLERRLAEARALLEEHGQLEGSGGR